MEVDIENPTGMRIVIEVGIGLEKDNIKEILEGMIEVPIVDLGKVQEQVLIKIE